MMRVKVGLLTVAVGLLGAALACAQDSQQKLDEEFSQAMEKFYEGLQSGHPGAHPAADFIDRYRALAEAHAQTPQAIPALIWILQMGSMLPPDMGAEATDWALSRLVKEHASRLSDQDLKQLQDLVFSVPLAKLVQLYEAVLAGDPAPEVAARTKFNLAYSLSHEFAQRSDPNLDLVQADLGRAADLFLEISTLDQDSALARQAAPFLFEMENLQVGDPAPDFAGSDVDGNELRLSDFRGRVVVIDFWGFW